MGITLKNLEDYDLTRRERIANIVAAEIENEASIANMKKVTGDELLARPLSVLALDGHFLAGHVSVKQMVMVDGKPMMEVGGLWVPTSCRRQGIASQLVDVAKVFVVSQQATAYAFVNQGSAPVFRRHGFIDGVFTVQAGGSRECVYLHAGKMALVA